jgi:hypothetical protein
VVGLRVILDALNLKIQARNDKKTQSSATGFAELVRRPYNPAFVAWPA